MKRSCSPHQSAGSDGLSLLARGRGLIDGGVEIECFSQECRDLSGRSFTKPSQTKEGQRAKIYKPHILNLPKTYVTRRGPLVLFTSPDDMIIGQSCQVHEQERIQKVNSLSRNAVHDIKTTNTLAASALTYDTEKDLDISDGEFDTVVKPGHFTGVYLETLAKLTKTEEVTDGLADKGEGDIVRPVDSDSGFDSCSHPTTSGRLSVLSYQSDLPPTTTSISIPDGQRDGGNERGTQVRFDDNVDFIYEDNHYSRQDDDDDGIKALMSSLTSASTQNQESLGKPAVKVANAKKKGSTGKTSTSKKKPKDDQKVSKPTESSNCSGKKTTKPTKKRTKKKKGRDNSETTSPTNSQVMTPHQLASELTDMNIDELPAEGGGELGAELVLQKGSATAKRLELQSARAEKRRLEIERKRQEKKELELQRAQELARQAELKDRIASYQEEPDFNKENNIEEKSIVSLIEDGSMQVPEEATDRLFTTDFKELPTHSLPSSPVAEQKGPSESAMLRKARESREKAQAEEMKRRESIKQLQRLKELEEEKHQKVKKEKERNEEMVREQSIKEIGKKVKGKEQLNYKMRLELEAQKFYQQRTPSHFFSYFCYVPPKQNKDNKKKKQRPVIARKAKS